MNLFNPVSVLSNFAHPVSMDIKHKLLYQLYYNSKKALMTLLLFNLVFFITLVPSVPKELITGWLVLILSINLFRIYDAFVFLGIGGTPDYAHWYRRFAVKSAMTAMLWGSTPILFLPYIEDPQTQLLIYIFILGVAGGAMNTMATNVRLATVYLTILLGPLFILLLLAQTQVSISLAFLIVLYYLTLVNINRDAGKSLIMSYEHEQRLQQAKKSLTVKQNELGYLASHDPLTSLLNRRGFMEAMRELTRDPAHQNVYSVLLYLDLNRFKQINDSVGHSIGDALLAEVGRRLRDLGKPHYLHSRLGGDEFIIVLPFVAQREEDAKRYANLYAERIQHRILQPFIIEGLHLYVKGSIGVVVIEPRTDDIGKIIHFADISMYQAKNLGSNTISFYNPKLDSERTEQIKLQHDLNNAAEHKELVLYFQPIARLQDDTLKAAEALLRWEHPRLGMLTPDKFIMLAVESGLIEELGWWVIEQVCRQIALWKARNQMPFEYISINIDARQLQGVKFIERLFKQLHRYNVDPSRIKLEITETSLIDSFEQTRNVLSELRQRGLQCAIDDFGTGYSSLSYLERFSFDILKIDKAFIQNILENKESRFLVESIIAIANKLNYSVIVEGIETDEQKQMILALNPNVSYQGYLFSKPIPAAEFEARFMSNRRMAS